MTDPHDWTHPAPPAPDDVLDLPRDIIGPDTKDVYALRVKGTSMIDALINDGDIVILRRVSKVENGDMAACWIKSQQLTTLRRYFLWPGKMGMSGRVTLKAENEAYEDMQLAEDDVQIQGKVIAVIRHV